ncbi:uncharacterized protein LOC125785812 [Astyanax mexicanus]|uniref:uncharacterized protein LOC125785812 n=1 Tax=Astyanax mexicanus TaxID=7994 RepID=UPI0020CB4D77|nr:uncharacterized protein LOC125785812 [Astyanax mexicanus]
MVQMLKALIVPGVLAVAGCCWWWYSSRKKTPGTSQDNEKKEDELSSSSGEEQCAQSETRAPLSSPEELPLQDSVEDSQPAESSEQEIWLEEPIIIIEDPQTKDTTVSAIELPELSVADDLTFSSEDGQCAQSGTRAPVSSPEELPLQDSAEDSQPDGQCAESSPEELPLQDTTIEDPQAEDTPVSAVELPELSVVCLDLSASSEDRQCAQSETGSISLPISTAAPVSSPEDLPLQASVGDSQPAWSSEGKRLLEEPIMDKEDPPTKDVPASFLGRSTKPRVLSTSLPIFVRDEKYEAQMESLSQVAWDTVMDDWY